MLMCGYRNTKTKDHLRTITTMIFKHSLTIKKSINVISSVV